MEYKSIKIKEKVHYDISMTALKERMNIMEFVEHMYQHYKKTHGKKESKINS